jgi:hypothetical protein
VIHGTLDTAVRLQLAGPCTLIVPVPPVLPKFVVWAVAEKTHAAACTIVKTESPREIVPVREAEVVFGAAAQLTDPLPFPLPLVIVIHETFGVAVQAQSETTLNVPAPPFAAADARSGVNVNAHDPADCVTVKIWPAMLRFPFLCDGVLFR